MLGLNLGLSRNIPWFLRRKIDGSSSTLWLDFTNNRYALNKKQSVFAGIIDFLRSTTATYVDANGVIQTAAINEPRFDYSTGRRGILLEEQRTNLIDYSIYGGSYGTQNNTITANSALAPDNTVSAVKFTRTSTAAAYCGNLLTKASAVSTPGAFSIFAKKGATGRYLAMRIMGTYPYRADAGFDLETGTVYGVSYNGSGFADASAKIEELSNGWYRCSVMAGGSDASTSRVAHISFNSQPTTQIDATDVLSDTDGYIWGWQFEQNIFQTSYIPTTGSTVTRLADNLSITGTNFSDWFNATEGSIIANVNYTDKSLARVYEFAKNGSLNDEILVYGDGSSKLISQIQNGGGTEAALTNNFTSKTDIKIAFAYAENNVGAVVDGGAVSTDTSATMPDEIQMLILGNRQDLSRGGKITIYSFLYYPTRLSNTALQEATQ